MPAIRSTLRLWHTVRHLRRRQWLARLRLGLGARHLSAARLSRREAPAFPGCRWRLDSFLAPGPQTNGAADLLDGRLVLVNRAVALGWPPRWNPPELPLLWRYNLHYFEWLWALEPEAAAAVARDWIRRNPLRPGSVAWAPYPVSLRLINWLLVFFARGRSRLDADPALREELWRSIHRQASWLERNLETHLLGNHLLENAAALAAAGCCFDGPDARRWHAAALDLLSVELREQFLPDGLHFELSPMYHLRATYLLLLLDRCGDAALCRLVRERLPRALQALACLRHPDGEIALLNDSACGIYNPAGQLLEAGGETTDGPDGCWSLPHAGYYGHRDRANGTYIVCDAGAIGPDYLPGHAHADIFSFELSLGGERVIVDSGVHDYEIGEMRDYCRSTRAHNTVEIEGRDQCEFWGAFRVARRGRPHEVRWTPSADGFGLSGWHDGYRRLAGRPLHRREFDWRAPGRLLLTDRVTAGREVRIRTRLGLHPRCHVERLDGTTAEIVHPGGRFRVRCSGAGGLETETSPYCPEFGRRDPRTVLSYFSEGRQIETRIEIERP